MDTETRKIPLGVCARYALIVRAAILGLGFTCLSALLHLIFLRKGIQFTTSLLLKRARQHDPVMDYSDGSDDGQLPYPQTF